MTTVTRSVPELPYRPKWPNGRELAMAVYKVHLLGRDGRVIAVKEITAIRNFEAVQCAERQVTSVDHCSGYELWLGDRQIARRLSRTSR